MISALLDTARPRRVREPMTLVGTGEDRWDDGPDGELYIPPVGRCLMLTPRQETLLWESTFTGDYARLGLADWETAAGDTLDTLPEQWTTNQRRGAGDHFLENLGGSDEAVFSHFSAYPVNRPWCLEWHTPAGRGAGSEVALECGWGVPSASGTVSLRVLANGTCQLWKGTTRLGIYNISDLTSELRRWKPGDNVATGPRGQVTGKTVRLFLVPAPPRQLLVYSSAGGGFAHCFEDLAQTGINEIVSSGRFWWRVAQGKASVQATPLTFPTAGYALRSVDELPVAPPLLSGSAWIFDCLGAWSGYGFLQSATVSLADASGGPWTADGSTKQLRLRLDLTGDGSGTPFVFYCAATLPAATANTDDSEEADIADHVRKLTLSASRSESKASGSLLIGDKDTLTVAGIRTQSNRPLKLRVSPIGEDLTTAKTLLVGVTGAPSVQQIQTEAEGAGTPVSIPFSDLWAHLERARWQHDALPLDGWLLTDAIGELLTQAGIPDTEWDIEDSTVAIPFPWALPVEFKYQPKAGDTVAKWLTQLHKDFAPTWYMGFYPTATGTKFRFRSASSIGTTPKATIWLHRDGTANRTAARDFKEDILPPEATRITVYGFDPGTRTFFRAGWEDTSLEDPTLAPSSRPTGWRGEADPLTVVDERLTTAPSVNDALDAFVARVASVEYAAQWASTLLVDSSGVPLWVGDVVRVKKQDGTTHGDYRIESLSLDLRREHWRDCKYAGVKL